MKRGDANKPVTQKQIRYIYFCAKKLGLDAALLHDVVYASTRKKSISNLTSGEAGDVIDVLARQAFPDAPRKKPSNVVWIITSEQKEKILALLAPMGWGEENADNLARRMYHKPVRHLTAKQAQGLIEALKSILSRTEKKTEGNHD